MSFRLRPWSHHLSQHCIRSKGLRHSLFLRAIFRCLLKKQNAINDVIHTQEDKVHWKNTRILGNAQSGDVLITRRIYYFRCKLFNEKRGRNALKNKNNVKSLILSNNKPFKKYPCRLWRKCNSCALCNRYGFERLCGALFAVWVLWSTISV